MAATTLATDPTAVVGRRIVAYVIDAVLGTALLLAVMIPLLLGSLEEQSFPDDRAASAACEQINDGTFGTDTEPAEPTFGPFDDDFVICIPTGDSTRSIDGGDIRALLFWTYLVSYGGQALNTVLLQGITGASVGKWCTGLRVVREDGTRAGIGWNLLRSVCLVADGQCMIGLVLVSTTRGHRRLGDMAASTYVVRRASAGQPIELPAANAALAPGPPPSPDGPFWDAARVAYIHFDRGHGVWVQWNETAQAWGPIDQ